MTTIAWTPGCVAADSCISHVDTNGVPGHRTISQKLTFQRFKLGRGGAKQVLSLASRGDAPIGSVLEALVFRQALNCLRGRRSGSLEQAMNRASLLKQRREIIKDGEVSQVLTWWREADEECFVMDEAGLLRAVTEPYIAIGWDKAPAYGSLRAGKDAIFAVESAAIYGAYTAKPIHYLKRDSGEVVFGELT